MFLAVRLAVPLLQYRQVFALLHWEVTQVDQLDNPLLGQALSVLSLHTAELVAMA